MFAGTHDSDISSLTQRHVPEALYLAIFAQIQRYCSILVSNLVLKERVLSLVFSGSLWLSAEILSEIQQRDSPALDRKKEDKKLCAT